MRLGRKDESSFWSLFAIKGFTNLIHKLDKVIENQNKLYELLEKKPDKSIVVGPIGKIDDMIGGNIKCEYYTTEHEDEDNEDDDSELMYWAKNLDDDDDNNGWDDNGYVDDEPDEECLNCSEFDAMTDQCCVNCNCDQEYLSKEYLRKKDIRWYVHRTLRKSHKEIYITDHVWSSPSYSCCGKKWWSTTNPKFKYLFTKDEAIKIRDILNKDRQGKRYLWVISHQLNER